VSLAAVLPKGYNLCNLLTQQSATPDLLHCRDASRAGSEVSLSLRNPERPASQSCPALLALQTAR
jgi:hypothetical protein